MINYLSRQERLQHTMKQQGFDGLLITHNVNLYYMTGSMQTGYLFVPVEGEALFFVKRSLIRALSESSVPVEPLGSFRSFGTQLAAHYSGLMNGDRTPLIGLEYDVLPVQQFQRIQQALPQFAWQDGSRLLRELRMIKSPYEISRMKEAAAIVDIAMERALANLKEGMTELELMSLIELTMRLQGHCGIMRMRGYNQEIITGMVGAGAAAAEPTYFDGPAGGRGLSPSCPQSSSRREIRRDEPILVDIGCCFDGYVIDQTRTVVIGELPDDLSRAYEISESILRSTEKLLQPGVSCESLYAHAVSEAEAAGLKEHFMGYGDDQVKFLGHGIGLEIDELPVLAQGFPYVLEPGMVIAVEPKFTFPGRGVVGIENTYLITESGYEKLTITAEGILQPT